MSNSIPVVPGADESSAAGPAGPVPDPAARPVRRTFTAEYRAQVVAEYEAAPHGGKAAVLRREGLYQSQVREWTAARDALTAQAPAHRRAHRATAGRGKDDPARLRAENERLTRELAKSQAVVAIMGKLQELLETISESSATDPPSPTR